MTTASPVPVEIMLHRQPVDGRKDGLLRTAAAAIGATCFSLGACFFIVQSFQEDWLPLFRVGCIVWLVGCAPYLALALAYARKAALSSTMLLVTGLTTYVVGCIFGLRTDIDEDCQLSMPALLWAQRCSWSIQLLRCDVNGRDLTACVSPSFWLAAFFALPPVWAATGRRCSLCRLGSAAGSRAQFCTMQGHATTG